MRRSRVAHVGDQVAGELPAGGHGRASRGDLAQQRGGTVSGEVAAGASTDQVSQQPVQPVDGLGAQADQVVAAAGQQVQHHRMSLGDDLAQPGRGAGGDDRDRDRVGRVGLAAVAGRQHAHLCGQLGRHIHHLLAVSHELLGQGSADPVGAFDRPSPLRPAPGHSRSTR
jgi:hypothetical protein